MNNPVMVGDTRVTANDPLASAWNGMRARCHNPNSRDYHNYGARGIALHPEWRYDWRPFVKYVLTELGPRPSEGHTLDRIDNDKGYAPGNLRWATRAEQLRNRRTNVTVVLNGEHACLVDAAQRLGVNYSTVTSRIERGWSVEKALHTPTGLRHRAAKTYTWRGQRQLTIEELAEISPVSRHTIARRLRKGWSLERAVLTPPQRRAAGS